MKKYGRFLFLLTVAVFISFQTALAVQPLKIQNSKIQNSKVQNPQLQKAIPLKVPLRVKPKLSVAGLQVMETQQLNLLRYQVKIKNDSTVDYPGGDILSLNLQYHVQATNTDKWAIGVVTRKIGSIGPKKEILVNGEIQRAGSHHHLKAVIMAGTSLVASRGMKLPEMPLADVLITNVRCEGDRLWVAVKNMSDLDLTTDTVLQFYRKAPGAADFQPAGGRSIALKPRGKAQFPKSLSEKNGIMKINIFLSRLKTTKVAEAIFNLSQCDQ
ncbi:MAG: hypothetical protein L3J57_09100 [Desulfuromusa sp.]|nr:hypothetical protein [Desulfuromusa sp.]